MNTRIFKENKLVIASHNEGKIREIKELLKPLNIEIVSAYELRIDEPIENGKTFEENALIKSSFVSKATGLPCISDDSGICFEDLNNEPGIYSARWAGKEKNFDMAMVKINQAINKTINPSKKCFFVCSLSVCWPDEFNVTVSGSVNGVFNWPPKGQNGFGYDPMFKANGLSQTFGEMPADEKHAISHRANAFKKLINACFKN